MKKIKIIDCSDSLMWYRDKVGELVEFVREDKDFLWSREDAGYLNIVKKQDGQIVDDSETTVRIKILTGN